MDDPKIGLTFFLLKQDQVTAFENKLMSPGHGALQLAEPLEGFFLPLAPAKGEPRWGSIIRLALRPPVRLDLYSQSPAGMLVLRRNGRTLVATFGHAWLSLEDQWLERDFGRRVALNTIARDKLVEIHVEQVFARWHLARERAPRASSVDEFGVEFDRDLVATVEGIPTHPVFGKTVRGGTNLRINVPLNSVNAVLDRATRLFSSNAYKKNWPDVDNIMPVIDPAIIGQLETQLDTEFQSGRAQPRIVMFTPVHRRDEFFTVDSYVFGKLSKTPPMTPYLTVNGWTGYLARKKLAPSVAAAKASPVHLLDENHEEIKNYSAFDCFGYELALRGKQYVLWSGTWYEVEAEFIERINRTIDGIDTNTVRLPAWNGIETEGEYNVRCAANGSFLYFDARNIRFGGGQSQFEFCDLFNLRNKIMCFVKIVSKSTGMSHLVEQVRGTAELLFDVDPAYRQRLAQVFRQHHPAVDRRWLESKPSQNEWHLCLVSLGRPADQLPFFAKCSLATVYKNLYNRGHRISFVSV
jgi:uncharacterized protein (TIGR04141 family)